MKVYLGGAINGCTDTECKDWREYAQKILGIENTLNPMDRDYRSRELKPEIVNEIVENDKDDICNSTCMLVLYEKPSVGTSMEILYAYMQDISIYIVDISGKSLSPWLSYHASMLFKDLDSALKYIKGFD